MGGALALGKARADGGAHVDPTTTPRDGTTAFEDRGRGTVVVLLHGYPFSGAMWRDQVDALVDRHRVIVPDLRGHGGTAPRGEISTMEDMADDVVALLDALEEPDPVVVGGLSMGGYVALALTRRHPGRVRALVLADTRPQADDDVAQRAREDTARKVVSAGLESVVEGMLGKLLAPTTLTERPDVVGRVRAMILGTTRQGAAAALRGMAARRDQSDLLTTLGIPTLIVVGSEDVLTPPADAMAMHRAIAGSCLAVIEGAGHVSNLERPVEFNRALVDFVGTLDA